MKRKIILARHKTFFLSVGLSLLWAALLPWACSDASRPATAKSRPNVVLLLIDALRPDKLGCYGFREDISPEIDRLAARGIQFKSVLAQCSWTRPSVGSLLTSLYPRTLGLYRKADDMLDDRFTTAPEILKSQNYLTIGVTANANLNKAYNFHQGFDYYVESDIVWNWVPLQSGQTKFSSTTKLKSAREIFETAMNILDNDKRRPFFIYAHLMDVHASQKTEVRPEFASLFDQYSRDEERNYYIKVRQTSADVGRFVQALLSTPGGENTVVIIIADHGEGLYDHPQVSNSTGHGHLLYESQVKVPLIFYHPLGGLEPRRVEQEVRLIDLLPTLLDYLGVPQKPSEMAGKSLLPLMKGTKERIPLPEYFVTETRMDKDIKLAVYSRNWIYIENRLGYPGVNPRELQSRHRRQNGKLTDFIHKKPEIAAGMEKFLKEWEKKFPESKPTLAKKKVSAEAIEQLRSLGYIK